MVIACSLPGSLISTCIVRAVYRLPGMDSVASTLSAASLGGVNRTYRRGPHSLNAHIAACSFRFRLSLAFIDVVCL